MSLAQKSCLEVFFVFLGFFFVPGEKLAGGKWKIEFMLTIKNRN